MITKNRKRRYNALKSLGLSTILVSGTLAGYATISHASEAEGVESATIVDVESATADTTLPEQGRGRPGGGTSGGRGGQDHHDQTLSEDAFDPNALVNVDTDAEVDTEADVPATEPAAPLSDDQIYYDGQYVGDAYQADRWGNMQVVAVVEDGELSSILIADYPRSTTHSDVISRNAMPTLISEAIEAQDADIDIVSGATDTSVAFIESLESALDDALIIQDSEGDS